MSDVHPTEDERTIERWMLTPGSELSTSSIIRYTGDWVRYEDHAREVERLKETLNCPRPSWHRANAVQVPDVPEMIDSPGDTVSRVVAVSDGFRIGSARWHYPTKSWCHKDKYDGNVLFWSLFPNWDSTSVETTDRIEAEEILHDLTFEHRDSGKWDRARDRAVAYFKKPPAVEPRETTDKPSDLKRDEKLRQVSLATMDAKLLGCGFVMILPDNSFRHVPLDRIQIKPKSSSVEEATAPIGAETDLKLHADMSREQVDAVMNRTAAARSSNQEVLRTALREARQVIVTACGTKAPYARIAIEHIDAALQTSWQPDETSGQSSLRAALEEILFKAPADNWWSRDIARKALNAPHSAGMRPALTAEQKRESVKAMYDDLIGGSSGD